jgi:hypothetical protein
VFAMLVFFLLVKKNKNKTTTTTKQTTNKSTSVDQCFQTLVRLASSKECSPAKSENNSGSETDSKKKIIKKIKTLAKLASFFVFVFILQA